MRRIPIMRRKLMLVLLALSFALGVAGSASANEGAWVGCPGHNVPGGGQQDCGSPGH